MPDIVPSSPEGQALQAAIQHKLAQLGWCEDDDSVMAEYCLVMLGNRKTADQISTELSDLIGDSFDASFVAWLFDEVKKHYPEPTAAPAPAAPASAPAGPAASSSRAGPNGIPSRPPGPIGGRNVFGAAVSGVKRGAGDLDGDRQGQRARFDAPSGPRAGPGGKSLFDRVNGNNPQFAPGRGPVNTTGMPQPAFDAITQAVTAIQNGAHPSILAQIPFPALAAHPMAQRLPPHIMAQAQANAMAQAQAMAAIQNVWNAPPGAFNPAAGGPPGGPGGAFNPNAPAFNPAFGPRGGASGPRGAGGAPHKPAAPPVVLPSKPAQEQICKHGVECTKPQCPYSHPSPVATKESGLVLSSEPCEKQLQCEDPDCPKSHVSKAQKTHPPSASSGPISAPPSRPASAAPPVDPSSISGAGVKPCKFGASCTRAGCVFLHPWDSAGPGGAGTQPCRYGAACTRADCHFAHPTHRPAPYNRAKYSATFAAGSSGAAGAKKAQDGIGAWPAESKEHISERLKRFAGGDAAGGEGGAQAERIVPGEGGANGDDKVEIHLDDDDEKKEGAPGAEVKEEVKA
ncbi:mRNA-binding protein nab2 [Rhodotorula kratochvilovae]